VAERARRRFLAVAAGLVAAGALGACATVPSAGTVRYGRAVGQGAGGLEDSDIHVLPPAPGAGQGPTDVVAGFLRASANFDDDHADAKRYLTPAAATNWNPDRGITVYDPTNRAVPPPVPASGPVRTITLTAPRLAIIDPHGGYTVAPGRVVTPFKLVRQGADWRLADPVPDGLLLTPTDVERDLRSVYTYFLDPAARVVVPDHVFLRAPERGRPTALVRALLDGPTRWLAPAVTTAFPPGTKLIGNVPLEGTVVVVNLSPEAGRAGPAARAAMSAQLVWTLRQLPDISGVRITIDGTPIGAPDAADVQPISSWSSFDPDARSREAGSYFVQGGRLRLLDGAAVPGPLRGGALPVSSPAIGGGVVAWLRTTATATALYAGPLGGFPGLWMSGPRASLTAPSVDRSGAAWTVRTGTPSAVLRLPLGAAKAAVVPATDLLRLGPVAELKISRDGTRAAAVVGTGAGRRLVVGRVVLHRGGLPSLEAFRAVAVNLLGPASLSWADGDRVAVLGRTGVAGSGTPWLVAVDGSTTTAVTTSGLPPGGPGRLAAGPGPDLLVAAGGSIYRSGGGGWFPVAVGTDPTWSS
jgi:hypothetical protein